MEQFEQQTMYERLPAVFFFETSKITDKKSNRYTPGLSYFSFYCNPPESAARLRPAQDNRPAAH